MLRKVYSEASQGLCTLVRTCANRLPRRNERIRPAAKVGLDERLGSYSRVGKREVISDGRWQESGCRGRQLLSTRNEVLPRLISNQ
jgi:hypothetical protein